MHQEESPSPNEHQTADNFADLSASIPRERLPVTRTSITHKFSVCGTEGYLIVGLYGDGRPGELFIKIAKEGSTLSGLFDTIGILTSLGLQYGVPLKVLAAKLEHTRFEPCGHTKNEEIPEATSLIDYIFRWLAMKFPDSDVSRTSGE